MVWEDGGREAPSYPIIIVKLPQAGWAGKQPAGW